MDQRIARGLAQRGLWRLVPAVILLIPPLLLTGGQNPGATKAHAAPGASTAPAVKVAPAARYGQLPLRFEANVGQTDPKVQFLARASGYTVFLTSQGLVLTLGRSQQHADPGTLLNPRTLEPQDNGSNGTTVHPDVLQLSLLGSNPCPRIEGLDRLPGTVNYFLGSNPRHWHTNIFTYARVVYHDVYPGIDQIFYGQQGRLAYDFVLAPGADLDAIHLHITGVGSLSLDHQGRLLLRSRGGFVLQPTPRFYELNSGSGRVPIAGRYLVTGQQQVAFAVDSYDRTRSLLIDPVLSYGTYLGGSGYDQGMAIAVDSSGDAYVAGTTSSTDFPSMSGTAPKLGSGARGTSRDVFVAKLNPEGTALLYSTYLGGSGEEQANSIAIDDNGDAYVTGATSSADFPGPSGIASKLGSGPRGGGGNDAFVAKLNPSGTALLYSVYLGGTGDDVGRSIAVDGGESAYVMGYTSSTDFPGPSGIAPKLGPGQGGANGDVFVAKLDPAGAALVYSTYLGGSGTNDGNSIAIDSTGDAFVTGWTQSADFPGASGTAPRFGPGSFQDAFVVKLNAAGNALLYGVYLGGSALDVGTGIAVDSSGDAYVVGFTESPDFPGASGIAPKLGSGADGAATDAFVAKLNPTGTSLLYGSYLGGSAYDVGYGIAVDGSGHAFVTGYTDSPDFPGVSGTAAKLGPGAPGGTAPNTGTGDAFVAELNTTGAGLLYSTYLGGSLGDAGIGIALDSDGGGSIYVTGYTISTDFPTQNALQGTFGGGGQDAFVAKIGPDTTPPSCALTGVITGPPKQIQITVQDSDGGLAAPPNGIVVSSTANAIVSIPSYSAGATNQVVVTATKVDQSESAQVGLRVTDLAGNVTNCDPVMTDLIRDSSKPSAITATGIAQSEHLLHIYNGDPGLNHLIIKVNGVKVQERDLEPNEQRTVDISAALHPGNNNRVVVIARGRQRGEATLVIADS